MSRSHIELAIGTECAAFDTMTGALSVEGFEGFWEDGKILRAYVGDDRWNPDRLDVLREKLTRIARDLSLPPLRSRSRLSKNGTGTDPGKRRYDPSGSRTGSSSHPRGTTSRPVRATSY
jgi:hypothetical protein